MKKRRMGSKGDQERVRALVLDAVALLCRNGLHFDAELRLEGLLGVTLDNQDVFLVHFNEKYLAKTGSSAQGANKSQAKELLVKPTWDTSMEEDRPVRDNAATISEPGVLSQVPASPSRKRKRRRNSRGSSSSNDGNLVESDTNTGLESEGSDFPNLRIKPEPVDQFDDDLVIVGDEKPKCRQTDASFDGSLGVEFGGFGGLTGVEVDPSELVSPAGPYVAGMSNHVVPGLGSDPSSEQGPGWDVMGNGNDLMSSHSTTAAMPRLTHAHSHPAKWKVPVARRGRKRIVNSTPRAHPQPPEMVWCGENKNMQADRLGPVWPDMVSDGWVINAESSHTDSEVKQEVMSIPKLHSIYANEDDRPRITLPGGKSRAAPQPADYTNKPFKCPDCSKQFYHNTHLRRHQNRNHGRQPRYVERTKLKNNVKPKQTKQLND